MSKTKKKKKTQPRGQCDLVCPRCGTYWASLNFRYGGIVNPQDVRILCGDKPHLKKGDVLACVSCQYEYNTYDIWLAVASDRTTLKPGEKIPEHKDEPELAAAGELRAPESEGEDDKHSPDLTCHDDCTGR